MITPDEDEIIPTGENSENDAEDQESQKDYHSDGVERANDDDGYIDDTQALDAADKASEAAYILHLDKDKPKQKE
ncbi:hypothetical protein BEL04_01995 [Mucilaginibacter sp. PPCGB 2223]|uniref:hypothetical protein n=1 Tax=Mucilaginibacter sp. PPCGB 2223 TaxID=1886027 RepID=UPI00082486FC|nr:hypothetical protein [Mucilaginibacter sp. PPCGB 2223]OCX53109.1 hypothetical protein BEL04_01995 [Mucilaginibacter sp. PPCGB 2223]